MFRLTYQDPDAATFLLPPGVTLVGRAPTCDLVVHHPSVSRRHARFEVANDGCFVEDVGSRLGTYQNGELIIRSALSDGDVLLLGQMRFDVQALVQGVALSDEHEHISDATVFLPSARTLAAVPAAGPSRSVDGLGLVAMFAEISGALVRGASLSEILDRVVAVTFDMTHAERVFLMLIDARTTELVSRVARYRDGTTPEGVSISRTIANKVMNDRVALLASDAPIDSRLAGAASVQLHNIRSCMCAPLWNQTDVIGILYVDNPSRLKFSAADLNLFTALSNYAAVAIEQARLSGRLLEETRRRERLQRYHSPRVIERILEGDHESDAQFIAQEREVSVLFADLVGFTTLSEKMTPSEVAHLLNGFFTVMTDVIFKHEGTLDKFIGDEILATFGAPLPQDDHAVRCVRTALEMRETLVRFNETRGGPTLRMRIAINSGCALVGDIGAPKRREFTVLGDVVNTASRLESNVAQPDQIVIGGETYRLIKHEIEARSLGSIKLRGRSGPIDVYEV